MNINVFFRPVGSARAREKPGRKRNQAGTAPFPRSGNRRTQPLGGHHEYWLHRHPSRHAVESPVTLSPAGSSEPAWHPAAALVALPIQQQTVIIAVRHEEEDAWTVDLLNTPPLRGRYDGWTDCLIDFDQYHGTVGELHRYAAEELASDLLDQAIQAWRHNREFGPHWDADPPDLN